jgi:hypothetical protein
VPHPFRVLCGRVGVAHHNPNTLVSLGKRSVTELFRIPCQSRKRRRLRLRRRDCPPRRTPNLQSEYYRRRLGYRRCRVSSPHKSTGWLPKLWSMVSVWASARAAAKMKKPPSPAHAIRPKPRTRFIIADFPPRLTRIFARSRAHCPLGPSSGQRETVFIAKGLFQHSWKLIGKHL